MSDTATTTGEFLGYLPASRIAEFRDDATGKTVRASMETGKTGIQAISGLLGLRCRITTKPRTPESRDDPDTAILEFQVIESPPKPHWRRQETALTADAKANFYDGGIKLLPVQISISVNPAAPEEWTAVIKVHERHVPILRGHSGQELPAEGTLPVYARNHLRLEDAVSYAEEMLEAPAERLKSETEQAARRREQTAETIDDFLAEMHRGIK